MVKGIKGFQKGELNPWYRKVPTTAFKKGQKSPRWNKRKIKCKYCKKIFLVNLAREKTAKFCNHKCYGSYYKGIRKSPETEFKKGQLKYTKNYRGRRANWHIKARKAVEKHYGVLWEQMCLPDNPIVHHIDGDITDNRFENLCVMSNREHSKYHYERSFLNEH